MREMKRTIAALLASLMMMSSISITSNASESLTEAQELAIAKVTAAGIMTGTDFGFEPSKTLTRAEAAAIMVRLKGIDKSVVKSAGGETLFGDVNSDHWATGYINVASSQGIIKGLDDGSFAPDKVVTIAEFTTMAVRALGAGTLVDSMGEWPSNYMNFANEEKLTDGVYKIHLADSFRIDAATIIANLLEANVWEKRQVTNTSEVTYEKQDGKTILSNTLDIVKYEDIKFTDINTKDREVTFEDKETNKPLTLDASDLGELATLKEGISYDMWYNADTKVKEVVGIWKAENSKEKTEFFTGVADVDTIKEKITLVVNGKEEEFDYTDETLVDVKGNSLVTDIESMEDYEDIFGTILLDGSEIKQVFGEMFTCKKVVKEIKNNTIYFDNDIKGCDTPVSISSIDLDDEELEFSVQKDGKEIKVNDIKEGDALYFYEEDNKYSILVNNTTFSGTVKSVSTNYAKIYDEKFDLSESVKGKLNAGDEIKFYIDSKGRIAMFEEIEGTSGNLAVVTSLRETINKFNENAIEIELTQLDGTILPIKEIDLDETKEEISAVGGITDLNKLLGTVVRFNDSKDGYVIEEMMKLTPATTTTTTTDDLFTSTEAATEEDRIRFLGNVKYSDDSMKLNSKYRLTDSTKVVVIKEGDKAYEKEISVVDVKDLGDITELSTSDLEAYAAALVAYRDAVDAVAVNAAKDVLDDLAAPVNAYIMGIDKNTDKVDTVVFTTDVNRSTDNNYAVVFDTAKTSGDDYETELTLLIDGEEELLLLSKKDYSSLEKGTVVAYAKDENVLTDLEDQIDDMKIIKGYILSDNTDTLKIRIMTPKSDSDDSLGIGTESTVDKVIDIASDAVYFSADEDGVVEKAEASDITQLSDEIEKRAKVYEKNAFCEFITVKDSNTQDDKIVAVKICKGYTAEKLTTLAKPAFIEPKIGDDLTSAAYMADIKSRIIPIDNMTAEVEILVGSNTITPGYTLEDGNSVVYKVTYTCNDGHALLTDHIFLFKPYDEESSGEVVESTDGKTLQVTYHIVTLES